MFTDNLRGLPARYLFALQASLLWYASPGYVIPILLLIHRTQNMPSPIRRMSFDWGLRPDVSENKISSLL